MPRRKPRDARPAVQVKISMSGNIITRNGVRLNYDIRLPGTATIGHVLAKLRTMMPTIDPAEALFCFHGRNIPPMSATIGSLANGNVLQLQISAESTFG